MRKVKLFDPSTGTVVELPGDEAYGKEKNEGFIRPDADGNIRMLDQRGDSFVISIDKAPEAFKRNSRPENIESQTEAYLEQEYANSPVTTFIQSGLSAGTMGLSDVAATGLGISSKEAMRERLARNRGAATAGEVVGVIGGALLPSGAVRGLGKATEKAVVGRLGASAAESTLGRVVTGVAREGAEGVQFGVGRAISELALTDNPKLSGERIATALWDNVVPNAVGGGILGGVGGVIGGGVSKFLKKTDDVIPEEAVIATSKKFIPTVAPLAEEAVETVMPKVPGGRLFSTSAVEDLLPSTERGTAGARKFKNLDVGPGRKLNNDFAEIKKVAKTMSTKELVEKETELASRYAKSIASEQNAARSIVNEAKWIDDGINKRFLNMRLSNKDVFDEQELLAKERGIDPLDISEEEAKFSLLKKSSGFVDDVGGGRPDISPEVEAYYAMKKALLEVELVIPGKVKGATAISDDVQRIMKKGTPEELAALQEAKENLSAAINEFNDSVMREKRIVDPKLDKADDAMLLYYRRKTNPKRAAQEEFFADEPQYTPPKKTPPPPPQPKKPLYKTEDIDAVFEGEKLGKRGQKLKNYIEKKDPLNRVRLAVEKQGFLEKVDKISSKEWVKLTKDKGALDAKLSRMFKENLLLGNMASALKDAPEDLMKNFERSLAEYKALLSSWKESDMNLGELLLAREQLALDYKLLVKNSDLFASSQLPQFLPTNNITLDAARWQHIKALMKAEEAIQPAGGMLEGAAGAVIGEAMFEGALGAVGGFVASPLLRKGAKLLQGMNDPRFIVEGFGILGDIDSGVGKVIETLSKAAVTAGKSTKSVIIPLATREDREKRRQETMKRINDLQKVVADPVALNSQLNEKLVAFNSFAPETTQAAVATIENGIKFLVQKAPKDPFPPDPLGGRSPWRATDAELSKFDRYLAVIVNPASILQNIADRTLTSEAVEAGDAVYPSLMADIREKVIENVSAETNILPYAQKQQLYLLLGLQLDDPQTLQRLQTTFASKEEKQESVPSAAQGAGAEMAALYEAPQMGLGA